MLKVLRIGLVSSALALGCAGKSEPGAAPVAVTVAPVAPAPIAAPAHALTGVFGECRIGCRFDFRELAHEHPRVKRTHAYHIEPEVTFEGVLTPLAIAQLKKEGAALANAGLAEHDGCGACVDGTDNTLVLAHDDGRVTEPTYDAQHPHGPQLQAADQLLRRLDAAFYDCTSNELIEIGAGCIPFEKLLEQSRSHK